MIDISLPRVYGVDDRIRVGKLLPFRLYSFGGVLPSLHYWIGSVPVALPLRDDCYNWKSGRGPEEHYDESCWVDGVERLLRPQMHSVFPEFALREENLWKSLLRGCMLGCEGDASFWGLSDASGSARWFQCDYSPIVRGWFENLLDRIGRMYRVRNRTKTG